MVVNEKTTNGTTGCFGIDETGLVSAKEFFFSLDKIGQEERLLSYFSDAFTFERLNNARLKHWL